MKLIKSNVILCIILCVALCGCSKEAKVVGGFGTGESVSESSIASTINESDKFKIKEDITLSAEETTESTNTTVILNNSQEAKVYDIEQSLKSKNTEIKKDDVIQLFTEEFNSLSESDKDSLATKITDKVNNSISSSNKIDSDLVYKYVSSYETDEIIIDEEAPSVAYSEEELESMHSEAEELYQQQQTAETFKFED